MNRVGVALFCTLAAIVAWWGWVAMLVVLALLAWLVLTTLACAFIAGAARERDTRGR